VQRGHATLLAPRGIMTEVKVMADAVKV